MVVLSALLLVLFISSTVTSFSWESKTGYSNPLEWLFNRLTMTGQWLLWGIALGGLGDLVGWRGMCNRGWMEGLGLRLAIGYALLMGFNFIISSIGVLNRLTLMVPLFVGLCWAAWRFMRYYLDRRKCNSEHEVYVTNRMDCIQVVLVITAVTLILRYLLISFLPETYWDALVYHLALPKLWFRDGAMTVPPWNDYARMPLNMSLVYLSGLAMPWAEAGARGAGLWATIGGGLLAGGLVLRNTPNRTAAWLAICLILTEPLLARQASSCANDAPTILFFFAAFLLLQPTETQKRSGFLSGIMAGVLLGIKLVSVYGVIAIGCILLWDLIRRRKDASKTLSLYCLGAMLAFSPWLIRAFSLTGNPVYPLLSGIFGSGDTPKVLVEQSAAWLSGMGMGRSLQDYLQLIYRIFFLSGPGYAHFDGVLNPLHLILLPIGFYCLSKNSLYAKVLTSSAIIFLLWTIGPQQLRFLLPAMALLSVAWAMAFEKASKWLRMGILAVSFLSILVTQAYILPIQALDISASIGGINENDYRQIKLPISTACDWIDRNTPNDAGIVMVFDNRAGLCPRRVLSESYFEASRLAYEADALGGKALAAKLIEMGYSYVLINNNHGFADVAKGFLAEQQATAIHAFLKDNTKTLWQNQGFVIGQIIP